MIATKLNTTEMNVGVGDLKVLLASISLFAIWPYNFFFFED